MEIDQLKNILEAALLAAGRPLDLEQLELLFADGDPPDRPALRQALQALEADYAGRGIELVQVGSGWRIQSRAALSPWVSRLWEERPSRYSRALLETLALVAYRQPITRGEIEEVRGVSISSSIMRTLLEREWVRVVGYRDVPGKPAMYGTTRKFLDYFGLQSLDQLPTLAELREIDGLTAELELGGDDGARQPAPPGDAELFAEAPAEETPGHEPTAQAGGDAPEARTPDQPLH
ncbi:MAG TPA: SMC-Scp complex subunit ScpB [Gammaproteobacteria bacterium]